MITPHEQSLKEAQGFLAEFEKTLEVDRLEEAESALTNVRLDAEPPEERPAVRAATLALWLDLLVTLDKHLDPAFNPEDVPPKSIEPPAVPGGVQLRPGAPPSAVADPVAREAYEKALAAHRERVASYRVQVYLHRMEESLPESALAFVKRAYRKNDADRAELRAALESKKVNPGRKAALEKILAP